MSVETLTVLLLFLPLFLCLLFGVIIAIIKKFRGSNNERTLNILNDCRTYLKACCVIKKRLSERISYSDELNNLMNRFDELDIQLTFLEILAHSKDLINDPRNDVREQTSVLAVLITELKNDFFDFQENEDIAGKEDWL